MTTCGDREQGQRADSTRERAEEDRAARSEQGDNDGPQQYAENSTEIVDGERRTGCREIKTTRGQHSRKPAEHQVNGSEAEEERNPQSRRFASESGAEQITQ